MTNAVVIAQSGSNNVTFRNRIINGAMAIWQRGTSYTPGSYYLYGAADRWCNNSLNTTYTQSSDVPSGFLYSYSIAGSSAAYPGTTQRIESFNTTDLVGQSVTVSAYIKKTTGNTTINATLFYASTKDNFGTLVSIGDVTLTSSPTSSWVRYTGTLNNLPSGAANGIQLSIYTVSGSSSDVMLITGVQLEQGSAASPFENRLFTTELQLCQRYFEMSYPLGTTPGTAYVAGSCWWHITSTAYGYLYGMIPFKVTKRAIPTITFWSYAGTAGTASNGNVTDQGACGINGQSNTQYAACGNSSGSTQTPAGSNITVHYTADAEL